MATRRKTPSPRPARSEHFTPELFRFLRQLERNNKREWFEKNKERYLDQVRDPMLAFIADFAPRLRRISRHLVADPRPQGGSMFRIYRDVRFSRDKRPYKTAAAARFQHERTKDVHAPGFYLHLGADGCFFGSGIWRPDGESLSRIRDRLVEHPQRWTRLVTGKAFKGTLRLGGESLKRPPRGYDPEHPLIEDLKRKDFTAFAEIAPSEVCAPDFLERYTGLCRSAKPFVKFLAETLDLEF
jgi:uncharacterized protein (TIGR02453 family)